MNSKEYIKHDKWLGGEGHPNPGKVFDILSQDRYKPALEAIERKLQENPGSRGQIMKGIDAVKQLPEFDALRKKITAEHPELTDNEGEIGPMTILLAIGVFLFILQKVIQYHDETDPDE